MRLLTKELSKSVELDPCALAPVVANSVGRGKLLRPLLVLTTAHALTGGLADRQRRRAVRAAAAVELLHCASLVHDDIIDSAPLRHGAPTVFAKWGEGTAIVAGDLLIALAFSRAAGAGGRCPDLLAASLAALADGQARELQDTNNSERTEAGYLASIAGKTAALFATACALGATVAQAPPDTVTRMSAFGHHLGMAFQITDDILDLTADPETTGKARGTDLCAGVYTLPVIRAMRIDPSIGYALSAERPPIDDIVDAVRRTGAVEASVEQCREHARKAVEALPENRAMASAEAAEFLRKLPESLLDRGR
ncbi:polyprenyl synthetase family protein [Streptomyces sp. URMC 123]|uniref:polyprenyl synthetase family protein n=1 Tax=Streptomyces sp. URMC 123 TaxID=3423403 RepID=UPI003F1BF210